MMSKALKGTVAAAAGVMLGLSGVAAAQAQDEEPTPSGASGTVVQEPGIRLNGDTQDPTAVMLGLDLGDGETRTVYCIQITVGLEESLIHEERPWEDIPVEDLPLVLGVLLNGYNGTNAAELLDAAGVGGETIDPFTAEQVAYAGTQAAIWELTDGWAITQSDPTEGEDGVDTAVLAVHDYLIANSEPVEEPDFEPYFEVDDADAVTDGAKVGPFTVATNFDSLTFAQPEGATVVDENGDAVDSFTDGQTFYVEFDEAATGSVKLVTDTITWTTPAGRTFVPVDAEGADVEGQRLILAEEHTSDYAAELEFEIVVEEVPSESPKPQLPVTGSSLTYVASIGGAVLVAGVVAMVLMRRRAARADWGSDA
ncbi:LPXTG-motif cell wall anchor domain-containing protein [Glycomyces sambucus]|uniref:LPXTG-motif cell wall anchor domain-containing protein n=1 Tax=Glycomyces sambucus TaxID=380244 RepID=A0A1G9JM67_9ACTN|nr:Cys-Gln thioester bond-forming surface protein [Glycomyces sambucus]SDL38392.1 LPXTG-motif cell wall anchor domain-containing protein [Glycomyces sambucus]